MGETKSQSIQKKTKLRKKMGLAYLLLNITIKKEEEKEKNV
jgi:hypothetical protein